MIFRVLTCLGLVFPDGRILLSQSVPVQLSLLHFTHICMVYNTTSSRRKEGGREQLRGREKVREREGGVQVRNEAEPFCCALSFQLWKLVPGLSRSQSRALTLSLSLTAPTLLTSTSGLSCETGREGGREGGERRKEMEGQLSHHFH